MDVDPLIPSGYDTVWTVVLGLVALACFALFLAAVWSMMSSRRLSGSGRLLWVLVLLAFPFLGALAWFAWGRTANLDRVL